MIAGRSARTVKRGAQVTVAVPCAASLASSSVAHTVPGSSSSATTVNWSKSGGGVSSTVRSGGVRSWVRTNAE
jgi:hypothetical protein